MTTNDVIFLLMALLAYLVFCIVIVKIFNLTIKMMRGNKDD